MGTPRCAGARFHRPVTCTQSDAGSHEGVLASATDSDTRRPDKTGPCLRELVSRGRVVLAVLATGLPTPAEASGRSTVRVAADTTGSDADPLALLGAQVAAVVRENGTVLAVYPKWNEEPILRRLQSVRSALDTTRLVMHPTRLSPLASAAFVDLLSRLAEDPRLEPADLVRSAAQLERRVVGAAWLGSVSRLREPAPTLAMHARSWLPNSAFAAVVDDNPRVVPLAKKGGGSLPLPEPDRAGWRVAMAIGEGDLARVERSLAEHAPNAPISKVPLGRISREWWGTDRLIEIALCPADDRALADELVTSRPGHRCPWCGERTIAAVCPESKVVAVPVSSDAPAVSSSAAEAREFRFLSPGDPVTMNRDRLIEDARQTTLAMARAGYTPGPPPSRIPVAGRAGLAALRLALYLMRTAGYISDYDRQIGERLAYVLSGGDLPEPTSLPEAYLLELEREAFLSLCGEPKTQERMEYMLKFGKPLRN